MDFGAGYWQLILANAIGRHTWIFTGISFGYPTQLRVRNAKAKQSVAAVTDVAFLEIGGLAADRLAGSLNQRVHRGSLHEHALSGS